MEGSIVEKKNRGFKGELDFLNECANLGHDSENVQLFAFWEQTIAYHKTETVFKVRIIVADYTALKYSKRRDSR